MNSYVVSLLAFVMLMTLGLSSVKAQTFQYSRGWTNGKRNGIANNGLYEINLIDKLLSNPCQLEKLRYILQGKPLNEKLMVPCELLNMGANEADSESSGLRLKRSASGYNARSFDNSHGLV